MKPRENLIFLKNDKLVILVKIRNFSRYRMTKRTLPLKSSRENLAITSNSETVENSRFSRHWVSGAVKRLAKGM